MFHRNDKEQNLDDFLKENFIEIYNAINDEGYIIEYPGFNSLKEILFEGKTVGFISFDSFHIVPNDLLINECYIIPEYRGNNLLYNELFSFITTPNANFFIRNPNKAVIKVLFKNGIASKFTDNLIVSYIKFVVMADTIYKNPKIKQFYKKTEDEEVPYKANVYDMDLGSVLFLDPVLRYVKYSDVFALTVPRKNDLKKYKLRKKLKRVNESYLDKCYDEYQDNNDDIFEFLDEVEEFVHDTISIENVFGTSEDLTQDFTVYLKENNLSEEDGFKIVEHLNNELDNGNLKWESCKRRMHYLVDNFDAIDNSLDEDSDGCPFCGHSNLDFIETCEFCGQIISSENYQDKFLEQLENFNLEDMLKDFQDSEDFDEFLGRVPIEENDSFFELKTFYNDYLTGFDFEDIKQYYIQFKDDGSIYEIMQNYFDFKISDEENEEKKFDLYKSYLCSFFYYYMDNSQFDEALSYIIQLAILASNDEDIGEGNIIERKPHYVDVFFELDQFLSQLPVYNLDNSYKLAIENFKVDKWLSNEEEIFNVFSQMLN